MKFRLVTKERFTCEFSEDLYCSSDKYLNKNCSKIGAWYKRIKIVHAFKIQSLAIVNTEKRAHKSLKANSYVSNYKANSYVSNYKANSYVSNYKANSYVSNYKVNSLAGGKIVHVVFKYLSRKRIFKLLRSPRIDSKSIPPGCVAWRAGTTNLFLLGSYPP